MSDSVQPITVHLIDPGDGRSLQSWSFSAPRITIGRGEGESIALTDPYVSRLHAEIVLTENGWQLLAKGRNGVFIDGQSVNERLLEHGETFRLGATGPMFRFDAAPQSSGQATLSFDPESAILLSFNRRAVEQQAQEIAESDYFQKLMQQAGQMRRRKSSS